MRLLPYFGKTVKKIKSGFTIIEIIMVISLMAIMTGGVIVNYRQSSDRRALDNASQRLRQAFTTARANSLAGKKDHGICDASPPALLNGWVVNLNTTSNPRTVSVYGICGTRVFPNPAPVENLPAGINITATDTQILFKPLNLGTDSSGVTNISVSNGAGTVNFSLAASGELLEPTPTGSGCRGAGAACINNGLCCSGSCNLSTFRCN